MLIGIPNLKPNQRVFFNCGNVHISNQHDMAVVCLSSATAVDDGYHLKVIKLKDNLIRIGSLSPSAVSEFTDKFN